MKMKDFAQIMVVTLIAIPFIYMAYDVSKDLTKKALRASVVTVERAKPVLVSLVTSLFK
jgi:hypothetical protein